MNAKVVLVVSYVGLNFFVSILTQDVYCVHIVYTGSDVFKYLFETLFKL